MTREQILAAILNADVKAINRDDDVASAEEIADAILAAQVAVPVPESCEACPLDGDCCTGVEAICKPCGCDRCSDLWKRLAAHFGRG